MKAFAEKLNNYFKPMDLVILTGLMIIAVIPWLIVGRTPVHSAVLRVDGQEIQQFTLAEGEQYTYTYRAEDGDTNVIEIKDQRIRIRSASCPDQRCVHQGWIEQSGETIVCLPHKLVIEIPLEGGDTFDP
ncbi:hypothetical protein NRIC_24810 [Enterococcus florum]|uniref:Uncharacterized protein n=1 Tax=Enterococcus florum TaxID=2480627 RepID=A0A4P5P9J6_9ENTE|nr:NusG domain II-containing protein [Enterococcus florum]GCF94590.1 hypothetical protein NRIC_24810 [Enterococcus florum]